MKTLEKYYEQLRDWKLIQDAEAVDITSAAKWYYGEKREQVSVFKDFPCVTPPYGSLWMEYGDIGLDRHNVFASVHPGSSLFAANHWRCGAAVSCFRVNDDQRTSVLRNDGMLRVMESAFGESFRDESDYPTEARAEMNQCADAGMEAHWGVAFFLYVDNWPFFPRGLELGCGAYLYLDEYGTPLPLSNVACIPRGFVSNFGLVNQYEAGHWCVDQLIPYLFALSLMNAKNVSLVDAPALPPKVLKRREREGKPALKFKVLQIDPMRARVKREAKPGENEVKVALHLCRGHFKDYRESGGLFGKYKGLYWWDSQVRGTDESGRIIKDYALNAPQPPTTHGGIQ